MLEKKPSKFCNLILENQIQNWFAKLVGKIEHRPCSAIKQYASAPTNN